MEAINWTTVLVAFFSAAASGIPAAIIALRTGKAVDGRMEELLELTRKSSHSAGMKDEHDAEKGRQDKKSK